MDPGLVSKVDGDGLQDAKTTTKTKTKMKKKKTKKKNMNIVTLVEGGVVMNQMDS